MRRKFIAGNWKMFTNRAVGEQLARDLVAGLGADKSVDVAVCPPFPYLSAVSAALQGSSIKLGAQNLYPKTEGAFTGEVSPAMLVDAGCDLVIIGHSERRHVLGETDSFINEKVHAGLEAGLQVILCVGEMLAEREAGETEKVLDRQATEGLKGIDGAKLGRIVVAYEPVWAIGTGKVATPEQAQEAHAFLRKRIGELCGDAAQNLIIQYGGSVKPNNAAEILKKPDVDGALVGGASLKADDFLAIIRAGVA